MIKPYKITQIICRRNDRCGAEEGRAAQVTKINQLGHLSNDYNYICPQSFFLFIFPVYFMPGPRFVFRSHNHDFIYPSLPFFYHGKQFILDRVGSFRTHYKQNANRIVTVFDRKIYTSLRKCQVNKQTSFVQLFSLIGKCFV